MSFWGPNQLVWALEQGSTAVFGSTHVVEQLSFSLFLSILTFDFDLILGSFLTFWGPNGLILCSGYGSKTLLGSTYVVEQFLTLTQPKNGPFGPQKLKNDPKIKSKSKVRIEGTMENKSCSTT